MRPEAPPKERGLRCRVLALVPGREGVAGVAGVDRPTTARRAAVEALAHRNGGVLCELARQRAIGELERLHPLPGETAALDDLLDADEPHARAQAALCALVADDARVALERLVRVRQPEAVVRVRHVVTALEVGQVAGAEDPRTWRVGIVLPVA